jgi:alpha-L-rhamnosidase
MKAINIKTEYMVNPIGLDITQPRITWNCEDGQKQTAYQIKTIIDEKEIINEKVLSNKMNHVFDYKISSRTLTAFQIKLWDENDKEGDWSDLNSFEIGLLSNNEWKSKWISGNYKVNKRKRYPVDCFKKEFVIEDLKKARLYISACGLYEAKINGKKVGEFVLAPGAVDYRVKAQYQTYDVTKLLKKGNNNITVELADGWYRGSSGSKGRVNTYGIQTKFIAQLEILKKDDSNQIICTDDSWSWSNDGPIRFADLKDGEIVDARKTPTYSKKAKEVKTKINLKASNNFEVKENETFKPLKIIKTPKGKTVLEFPQNLSGYISFKIKAHEGQKIHITMGEMLDSEGELTLKNIQCTFKGKQSPLQEIDYTCMEGINEYKSKFYFGGFKYAQIDTDVPFDIKDFKSIAVYSAFEETSSFECSNKLINHFYKNTLWSLKSNSTDVPTDCPTRERMGWTGDSEIFFNTASYMVNYAPFARKHVRDIFDRQSKSGRLPQIAPYSHEDWFMWVMNGSVGWACAGVYIPLYYFYRYGDDRLLKEFYEGIIKYANFMIRRAGKWGGIYAKHIPMSHKNRKYFVNCGQSYGEWAEPSDVMAFQWFDFASPHPEESTAYTYFTLKRVLEIADILEKKDDKRLDKIKEYSEGAKRAYQEFVTKKGNTLDTDRQAKLVRPLYMGLLNKGQEEYAKKRLLKALDNYGWRLGTGFLSTPLILDVLSNLDVEYAYKLLENEELPGWLFMVKHGATTVWESWEGNATKDKGLASLNHYSKGAMCEWLVRGMCGINIAGEGQFIISPLVGGKETYAKCAYNSIYGKVFSSWKKEKNKIIYEIEIPTNTTAEIILNNKKHSVGPGKFKYETNI